MSKIIWQTGTKKGRQENKVECQAWIDAHKDDKSDREQIRDKVEEKFEKIFRVFSEMRAKKLYIDPSKSKFWIKI